MPDPYVDVLAWNSAEGGTADAAVTAGNSGGLSGTALSPQVAGASVASFTNTNPIHGSLSYHVVGSGGLGLIRWLNGVVGTLPMSCGVAYIKLASFPTGYTDFIASYASDSGGNVNKGFAIRVSGVGNLRLVDSLQATVASGTTPIAVGQVYRIEWQINHATSEYVLEWFEGDSEVPMQQLSGTSATGFLDATRRVDFGRGGTPDIDIFFDDLAIADHKIGPRFVPSFSAKPIAVVDSDGWTAVGGPSLLGTVRDELDSTYAQSPTEPTASEVRWRMAPLRRSDFVTVHTRDRASDATDVISRTVRVYNGATLVGTTTFTLTTNWANHSVTTTVSIPAGVELEVVISDSVI